MKDYYQLLNVPATATQAEIRKAYYRLAHQYHPDKTTDPQHHRLFLEVKEAYEILGDAENRKMYHYRWVNFKNPAQRPAPTASRPAAQAASRPAAAPTYGPTRRPYSPFGPPPPFARHYQNYTAHSYKEYEGILRQVCFIGLIISLLILADLVLAYRIPNQVVTHVEMQLNAARIPEHVTVYTPESKFRLRYRSFMDSGLGLGIPLTAWKTPFFRQTIKIEINGWRFSVSLASVYHNFLGIVLLQLVLSGAGLNRKASWSTRLNVGVMAGIITALTLIILFTGF